MSSNNDSTLLLVLPLHCNTSLHFTQLHLTTLHPTTLHHTSLNYTSPQLTQLHFTTLHPTTLHHASPKNTSPHFTQPHFTQLHFTTLNPTTNFKIVRKLTLLIFDFVTVCLKRHLATVFLLHPHIFYVHFVPKIATQRASPSDCTE